MWRYLLADLHLHTVLSPCAEVEMIPPLIVRRAQELGLEVIAVTDHNAVLNAAAVIDAARAAGTGLTVLPGMEVQSREEVHLTTLFDTVDQALTWQERVWAALPDRENDEAFFGAQFVVDATGEYRYTEKRMLSMSTALSIEEVVLGVKSLGGIVLPAHVDRPANSLISNLGFVPPGLEIAGLELSRRADPAEVTQRLPQIAGYGHLVSGDAHRLEEMTARTMLKVAAPTVAEIALALAGQDGRRVEILKA
ncbi:MAG: PHP domain-containing protein [Anaerolineae bacterium]|nr:PHP domain-containing protein [Anaerolineae bacterium]